MKDVLGNDLALGDTVVTTESRVESLLVGKIVKFTPKGCRISFIPGQDLRGFLKMPYQVCLVEEAVAIMYWLANKS